MLMLEIGTYISFNAIEGGEVVGSKTSMSDNYWKTPIFQVKHHMSGDVVDVHPKDIDMVKIYHNSISFCWAKYDILEKMGLIKVGPHSEINWATYFMLEAEEDNKKYSNTVSKPKSRNSGRYPWGNASGIMIQGKYYKTNGLPVPKKVIFNGPATVVLWTDNTKTVVKKSKDEPDDREKALMYCVFKKFLDDKKRDVDRYLKLFYKVLEEDNKDEEKEEAGSSESDWKKPRAGSGCSEGDM